MRSIKENSIVDYMSKIDFKNDDWKLSKIKEDMRRFLGEEPAIEVVYKKNLGFFINESTGQQETKEILDIDKIEVIFTDLDDKFKKIEFKVNQIL